MAQNRSTKVTWLWPIDGLTLGVMRWSARGSPWLIGKHADHPGHVLIMTINPDAPFIFNEARFEKLTFALLDMMDGRIGDDVIESIDVVKTLLWLGQTVAADGDGSFERLLDNVVVRTKTKPTTR